MWDKQFYTFRGGGLSKQPLTYTCRINANNGLEIWLPPKISFAPPSSSEISGYISNSVDLLYFAVSRIFVWGLENSHLTLSIPFQSEFNFRYKTKFDLKVMKITSDSIFKRTSKVLIFHVVILLEDNEKLSM